MARAESLAKGGYYAFPEHHLPDVARLFAAAPSGARILDPCAGEGIALQALADTLKLSPYAVELEPERANECKRLFPVGQVLHADMFAVELPHQAVQVAWVNPPFTWDTAVPGQRREAGMLDYTWRWLQPQGWMIFVSYTHHLTKNLLYHIADQSSLIEVYRLPEKHFDTYTYSVLIAQKGKAPDATALAQGVIEQLASPDLLPLLSSATGQRRIPVPQIKDMYFHKTRIRDEDMLDAVHQAGADLTTSFQIAVRPPADAPPIRPPMKLKLGHMVTLVAGGMFNYLPLQTERGRAMLRSVVRYVEELTSTDTSEDGKQKKETYTLRPKTTITVLHADGQLDNISDDAALNDFIQQYKQQLFAYADENFKPRYSMTSDSQSKRKWLPHLLRQRVKGKYKLFPAQMHVGAAICTTLEQLHRCLFVGEMSCGKTNISIGIMDAWHKAGKVKPGQVMWINCPSHLVKKWAREATQQLPSAVVTMLVLEDERGRRDMLADLGHAMRAAQREPQRLHILVAAQDAIKLGEGWTGASQTNIVKKIQMCPTTGEAIKLTSEDLSINATPEQLNDSQVFSPDRRYAYWQEARKFGLPKGNNGRAKKQGDKVVSLIQSEPIVDNWLALRGVRMRNPRGPVWRLVQGRYRGRIAIAFFDEAHGSKDIATDRYRSMAAIARSSDNFVGLSGTIFNGYASSLYGLETIFNPRLFERYPWGNAGISQFVRDMGVLEKVVEYKNEYSSYGTFTGVKRVNHGAKERPGASPLLIQMLLDHAVFLSLADIGKALPKLEETPVAIPMSGEQTSVYKAGMEVLKGYLNDCRKEGDASFLAAYFRSSLAYPDTAVKPLEVIHHQITRNQYNRILSETDYKVHTFRALDVALLPKEAWLIDEIVSKEIAEGRGVGIFVTQTDKRDYQPRLAQLLRDQAKANPVILYSDTVKPIDREAWIEKEFISGKNVLICNPRLVETGLDLLMCPTLIFFEPEYQLAVLAQAARRHWRIPQEKDCRTYYVYYGDTMQERAMNLITDKLQSLSVVNGESASLSALSQVGDILKELMKDDENMPIKDLRAEFAAINQRDYHDAEWEATLVLEETQLVPAPAPEPKPIVTVVVMDEPPKLRQLALPF